MLRPDTLPYESYFYGAPDPYIQPAQSKYHNLGMNGFMQFDTLTAPVYPGKNMGIQGDYGPRQVNLDQIPARYPYPLDVSVLEEQRSLDALAKAKLWQLSYIGAGQDQ